MISIKNKLKLIPSPWYYFTFIVFVYLLVFIFRNDLFLRSMDYSLNLLAQMIPVFGVIFVFMTLTDYFISPEFVIKHMGAHNKKKWLFVILAGMFSSGPPYMWYPLLANLRHKVLDDGMIACFLYNWAIKIPLLPMALIYFSWRYVLILCLVMIGASLLQGYIINKLMKIKI